MNEIRSSIILKELQKVLASNTFTRSGRLRTFLRFAVETALQGKLDQLKEYTLAIEVFAKSATFDPRLDPIIRVEARRLRSKLLSYYQREGYDDPISINIPIGSYVPVFQERVIQPSPFVPKQSEIFFGSNDRSSGFFDGTSVAVLPFINVTSERRIGHFSDGLAEAIGDALAQMKGSRVVARTSAWKFKDRGVDVREIGRLLNVGVVVEGSVRKSGQHLRIAAQLSNTADGYNFWSRTYERTLGDEFKVQDEIARAIVGAIDIQFGVKKEKLFITADTEANELCLKGMDCLHIWSEDAFKRAANYFEQALAKDQNCDQAYEGLAIAFFLPIGYGTFSPKEVIVRAKLAASRGLRSNESLAGAHVLLALVKSQCGCDWSSAWRHYEHALQLNPYSQSGLFWYSWALATSGQLEEAFVLSKNALLLNASSALAHMGLGRLFQLAGRHDCAIDEFRKGIELDPTFPYPRLSLGITLASKSSFIEALEKCNEGKELSHGSSFATAALGYCQALAGNRVGAQLQLKRLEEQSISGHVPQGLKAFVYVGLSEKDRALACLKKSYEEHYPIGTLKFGAFSNSLGADPGFARLLTKMNLSERQLAIKV